MYSSWPFFCTQRIIDNIPRLVDHDFLQRIADGMFEALNEGLLASDDPPTRAAEYLEEDRTTAEKRATLIRKKELLIGVLDKLKGFGM